MDVSFQQAFSVQRRVIWALMLRESKTLFGKHKLGYFWAFIQSSYAILIFWAIREFAHFHPPHGMSTPVFLITGFVPWYVFATTTTSGMNSIPGNRALLGYPQVFPLDLVVSRALMQASMQAIVMFSLLTCAYWGGQQVVVVDLGRIFIAFSLAIVLGFGFGTICSAFNLMQPATARIVPMIIRVGFFTSGLFFSVSSLPDKAQEILFYNPMCHVIEMMRSGFSVGYGKNFVRLDYAVFVALIALALGLLLERYSRKYLDRI